MEDKLNEIVEGLSRVDFKSGRISNVIEEIVRYIVLKEGSKMVCDEFNWNDVKPGMAFTSKRNGLCIYVYKTKGEPCFSIKGYPHPQSLFDHKSFTRNPEEDNEAAR